MSEEIKSAIIRIFPFLIILVIFSIRIKQGKFKNFELYLQRPESISLFLKWWCGFLLLILAVEFLLFEAGKLEIDKWNHSLFPSIIRIIGAVILAPIAEEIVFRGILLSKLISLKINRHLAIVLQALVFVLLHNFTYQFTFTSNISVVQGFLDGMLYAYAKNNTKSLYTPIAMHMTGNLIATLERFLF